MAGLSSGRRGGRKSATEKEKPRDWLRFFVILLIRTNSSRYNYLSVCVASRYLSTNQRLSQLALVGLERTLAIQLAMHRSGLIRGGGGAVSCLDAMQRLSGVPSFCSVAFCQAQKAEHNAPRLTVSRLVSDSVKAAFLTVSS